MLRPHMESGSCATLLNPQVGNASRPLDGEGWDIGNQDPSWLVLVVVWTVKVVES